jgi:hypothetical protein
MLTCDSSAMDKVGKPQSSYAMVCWPVLASYPHTKRVRVFLLQLTLRDWNKTAVMRCTDSSPKIILLCSNIWSGQYSTIIFGVTILAVAGVSGYIRRIIPKPWKLFYRCKDKDAALYQQIHILFQWGSTWSTSQVVHGTHDEQMWVIEQLQYQVHLEESTPL